MVKYLIKKYSFIIGIILALSIVLNGVFIYEKMNPSFVAPEFIEVEKIVPKIIYKVETKYIVKAIVIDEPNSPTEDKYLLILSSTPNIEMEAIKVIQALNGKFYVSPYISGKMTLAFLSYDLVAELTSSIEYKNPFDLKILALMSMDAKPALGIAVSLLSVFDVETNLGVGTGGVSATLSYSIWKNTELHGGYLFDLETGGTLAIGVSLSF